MNDSASDIELTIAALERQRSTLGDTVVDTAIAALREQLRNLVDTSQPGTGLVPTMPVSDAVPASSTGLGEAAAPREQQLRQVSVLFTDVVGSTAFSQHLDPEDIHQVMDGALARFSALVRAHEGVVLQYAGDSMLAAFGTRSAREDDAERAVLAGLAIVAEGHVQGARVMERFGLSGFGVRVGVHTGPVLLGGGVDGDQSIRGLTVNIAARMEQTAPAGQMRISHDTWRHVRGLFDVEEQPPLQVKGHDAPLQTYLVLRARPRSQRRMLRGVDGLDTPMVNRIAEMATLKSAFDAVCAGGSTPLAAVTVVGDAGLGKSRLSGEFRRWVAQRSGGARWLEAYAGERDSGQPYGMLRGLFMRWLNILDSDPLPLARSKWLEGMAPLLHSTGDAAVLGHLLGLDFSEHAELRSLLSDAKQLRDRAFFHASQALRSLAAPGTPLLMLLDDLHWADEGTLDFIEQLLSAHADMRLLLIGLTRPTLYERRPGWARWAGGPPQRERIDLMPLDGQRSIELANALLRHLPEVPAPLRELLTGGAEGNPFYMEELVNMLIDQGVIVTQPEGWQLLPARLQGLSLPTTLTGVLQARLDSLPGDELHLLQLAAVIGPVFWDDALRALGIVGLAPLHALVERELVVLRETSSLEGRREFAFRHHTLHQVAYERLLRRFKRPAHAQVAQWLLAQPGAAPDLVAEHFERGGEPALALDHWQRAAELAHARYALAQARSHAERALALVPVDAQDRRWQLLYLLARVLGHLSAHEALAKTLDQLQELAETSGQPAQTARVLERRGRFHYETGDATTALQCAEQALALANSADVYQADAECAVSAHALVVFAMGRLGRHAEARTVAGVALVRARAAGLVRIEAMLLNEIGNHLVYAGDFGAASQHLEQALALHLKAGDRLNESGTMANLAFVSMTLGNYEAAKNQFLQTLGLSAAIGQRKNEGIIRINLALALMNQGLAAEARPHAFLALDLLKATRNRWGEAAALRVAGQVVCALGQTQAAAELLEASRVLFDQLEMPHLAIESIAQLALLALESGNLARAMAEVQTILDRQAAGASLEGTDEPLRVRLACWRVLDAARDPRAAESLTLAWQELDERASRIVDAESRHAFVNAVPFHREIAIAWQARASSAAPAK